MLRAMRAMVLEQQGRPLAALERARPRAGRPAAARSRARLRRLPHGPARRRRRPRRAEASARPRSPGRRRGGPSGAGGGAVRGRRPGRDPVARLDVRRMPLLPLRAREPLRRARASPATSCDGGYAELAVADERYCLPLAGRGPAAETAPLLCAGLIGYRALRLCGEPERLGLYGFGASAHIVCQVAVHRGRACSPSPARATRPAQAFARELGAEWAGGSDERRRRSSTRRSSSRPVGELVPVALRALAPGRRGRLRRHPHERHPGFPYARPLGRAQIRSVANLTRRDGEEFLGARAAGSGAHHGHRLSRSRRPTRRSPTCAPAASTGSAVLRVAA